MKVKKNKGNQYINTRSGLQVRLEVVLTNPSLSDVFMRKSRPDPWVTRLGRYQKEVGIGYYNLDISQENKVEKFLLEYLVAKIPPSSDLSATSDIEKVIAMLKGEQRIYRSIFNRLAGKEPLTEDQIIHIESILNNTVPIRISQRTGDPALSYIEVTGPICANGFLKAAFFFLLLPSTRKIQPEKCSFDGCTNVFIPHPGGHSQKYCSDSCKVKAYNRRKAQEALTSH